MLQHSPCEDLGAIAPVLRSRGLVPRYLRTHLGEPVPAAMGETVALLLLGGPMGVYDRLRYPFLGDEMRLIEQALKLERPVLGVCLGSQLLAAALGAGVAPGPKKEIGWYPVQLLDDARSDPLWSGAPTEFCAFHWHGDIFELPEGAIPLASSELTAHQSFRLGSACGCLFHMEITEKIVRGMVDLFADELAQEQLVGEDILTQTGRFLPPLRRVGDTFFHNWATMVMETQPSADRGRGSIGPPYQ